ncbi:MAG: glycosyltransferase family 2 protein [bacterium]
MTQRTEGPLVSIVTPVLNRASSIRACLASVASQTYHPMEHLIVDGGSSDGTLEIVREFESDVPRRWVSEPDEGMYDAINKGLRLAKGTILGYVNSDDAYLPWSVEVAVEQLEKGPDLLFGDLGVLHDETTTTSFYIQFYPDFDLAHYTHVATIGQPTVFWRRSLMERIGLFDDSYRLIGDCEYWLRAAVAGANVEHVDEVLAVQTEHSETLRARYAPALTDEFTRLRARYAVHSDPPGWPLLQRLKKSLVWRQRQLQFRRALRRSRPDRWPRFIDFLRRRSIQIDHRAMTMFMLPERFRPARSPWGDMHEFARRLMDEIGAPADSPY